MSEAPTILALGAGGWHWRELRRAAAEQGVGTVRLPFTALGMALDGAGGSAGGLRLGRPAGLPDAVLVRTMPAGSFEQVTLRLGVLHALADLGVPVVNDARVIERCVDKSAASFHLARAGLPTPPTWVTERAEVARAIVERETAAGRALVVKPLFGAQGKGLALVPSAADLPDEAAVNGVWYLQRYIGAEAGWQDFRVLVVGDRAVAAMRRHGASWITNIKQGARPEPVPPTGTLAELAVAATRAVGADYAGVDLMADGDDRLQVLEVNSMPAWYGLQGVTDVDIAGAVVAHVVGRVNAAGRRREPVPEARP